MDRPQAPYNNRLKYELNSRFICKDFAKSNLQEKIQSEIGLNQDCSGYNYHYLCKWFIGNVIISYQGIADIAVSKHEPGENYHLKSLQMW